MLTVNIPEQAKPLIELLATMPEDDFEALKAALSAAPPNLRIDRFSKQVKKILADKRAEMADLVDVITALSRSPRDESVSPEELATSISRSLLEKKPGLPDPGPRLAALLGIESLRIWAKANNVQHQYEEIFGDARIISDIRTVFEADGVTPMGAMIVHNLKMISIDGKREHHEKYYALDNADLDILLAIIQRAKEKTASLEKIINKSKLTYFHSE